MRRGPAEPNPAQAIAQRMRAMEAELHQARQALRRDRKRASVSDRWGLEQPATDSAQEDIWFITYLDMMTLLLVAMIVMLAFSGAIGKRGGAPGPAVRADAPPAAALAPIPAPEDIAPYSAEDAARAFASPPPLAGADGADGNPSAAPAAAPAPDQEAPSEGAALAASLPLGELGHDVEVIVNRRSISFRINSEILFGTGQADLSREGLSVLRRMARVLSDAGYDITVEGHTDSVPVRSNARYPSNWELSSARAGSVVRYLQANGIAKEHLKAVGYADSRPIADNRSPDGRSRNRRVELVVEKPHEDRDKAARSDSRPGAETAAAPESSARP